MVPMNDGVKLATDVYWPADGTPPYPTILIRTPYNKAPAKGVASRACPLGYAVVIQDMRGRFASQGRPVPIFGNEGLGQRRDGHDTIAWITGQKWSDGRIAMWGGSALGIVQNMVAPGASPALKGQVVMEAFSDYYHQFTYRGGVWQMGIFESWARQQGLAEGNLELFRGHPYYDEFWEKLSPERYAQKVNTPAVFIGGWYDFFSQGTLNSFMTIQDHGGPDARGKCFLVMGPVPHGLFHDRQYRDATKPPIEPFMPMEFYAHWLKGEKLPALKPVHYYVMGALGDPQAPGNRWRSADTWPPPADATPFYLHADGSLRRGETPTGNGSRTYMYNPANPVIAPESQGLFPNLGPTDLRSIESRPDVLTFTSPPLDQPLEVTGRIYARLYVSCDCPDTDFTVTLTDVYPDDRSLRVTEGIRRASLRKSFEKPDLLTPGQVYQVEVDLWSTSIVFNKGHRIRIAVSSSNSPQFEPNPNTGDPHPVDGLSRAANNTIHLAKDHPSHILLPLYKGPDPAIPCMSTPPNRADAYDRPIARYEPRP